MIRQYLVLYFTATSTLVKDQPFHSRIVTMPSNSKLVADIEALLATAKTYDVDHPDRLTRLDLMGRIEALHYQLDDPAEAMFRQLTNVRPEGALSPCEGTQGFYD